MHQAGQNGFRGTYAEGMIAISSLKRVLCEKWGYLWSSFMDLVSFVTRGMAGDVPWGPHISRSNFTQTNLTLSDNLRNNVVLSMT